MVTTLFILAYVPSNVVPRAPDGQPPPWRMLIVDGHSSHVTWPVAEYALDHRIVPYCLPPHSTHLMQPLDVACFSPLGRTYRTALHI